MVCSPAHCVNFNHSLKPRNVSTFLWIFPDPFGSHSIFSLGDPQHPLSERLALAFNYVLLGTIISTFGSFLFPVRHTVSCTKVLLFSHISDAKRSRYLISSYWTNEGTWLPQRAATRVNVIQKKSTGQRNAYCFLIVESPSQLSINSINRIYPALNRGWLLKITPQTEPVVKQDEFSLSGLRLIT